MSPMPIRRRVVLALWLFGAAAACSSGAADDADVARGRGLKPAALTPAAEARVIEAASRAAFDVGPQLVLRLHAYRLPRTAGMALVDTVPRSLIRELDAGDVVHGVCNPKHDVPRDTPYCAGAQTGYVVRTTPPLLMPGDTVEIYYAAEVFGPDHGPRPVAVRFEKIYQLVGRDAQWTVVREARVKGE